MARTDDAHLPLWVRSEPRATGTQLSRDKIVGMAVDLVDADGLAALTMRRLAAELDARVMTLYTYVPTKEDLLDLMFDELAGRTLLGDAMPDGWRPGLRAIAHRVREMGLAHPWSVDLLGGRATLGPNTMRLLDEWVSVAGELVAAPADAWRVVTAVNDYVTGYVVREAALRRVVPPGAAAAAAWHREVGGYLRDLADGGRLPHLAPLLRDGFAGQGDNFDTGLDWLLDSVAARYS